MRRFLFALVLLLAVVFLITRMAEVQQVTETIRQGDWRWLGLGFLVHLLYMFNLAASFQASYRLLGVQDSMLRMLQLSTAANFVNIVAPSGGTSGVTVLWADAHNRNRSLGRVTTAAAVFILFEYLSLLIIIMLGMGILFERNQLESWEIIPASLLAFAALFLISMLYLGMRSPSLLGRTLKRIGKLINTILRPFMRRDYLKISKSEALSHDISAGLALVRQEPKRLVLPGTLALSSKVLLILLLLTVFEAFHQPYSASVLITTFGVSFLFYIISPTPSGVGFTEGATTVVLGTLGIPLDVAVVITLAFRGFTFWLTLLYGLIAFRWVGKDPRVPSENEDPPRDVTVQEDLLDQPSSNHRSIQAETTILSKETDKG